MDLADRVGLQAVFQEFRIGAVLHFAAFAYVGESMRAPAEYFRNNVVNTLNLLDAMRDANINQIVFSSTCATYGVPEWTPMTEQHPQKPVNPCGESKLMVERVLDWYGRAYGLQWSALRHFNAAGADPHEQLGEAHEPETHLIPLAIEAACGDGPELQVFGTDYQTPDGTAVRDYIHVSDLASAHVSTLERLARTGKSDALNLGTGRGHSVREVIEKVEQVTKRKVPLKNCPRRSGDPAVLVADASYAGRELGWVAKHSSLDEIIETAWRWHSRSRTTVQQSGQGSA